MPPLPRETHRLAEQAEAKARTVDDLGYRLKYYPMDDRRYPPGPIGTRDGKTLPSGPAPPQTVASGGLSGLGGALKNLRGP
jgi:hypothetical protein